MTVAESNVAPALASIMSQAVDYAGLFPPAKLEMEPAIRNYAAYRPDPDAWMLARFVVPAQRLHELTTIGEKLFQSEVPFQFSILGQGGANRQQYLENLTADLTAVNEFNAKFGAKVDTSVFEIRLPTDVASATVSADDKAEFMSGVALNVQSQTGGEAAIFHEVPWNTADFRQVFESLALAINRTRLETRNALKIRTGGLEAAAFPSADRLSAWIWLCNQNQVTWKATAGLHHPIRKFDGSVNGKMYGFLNVMGAAVFAHVCKLDESQLLPILEDESAESFAFEDGKFSWRNLSATAEEVAEARKFFAVSFGSCSFDEPRDDLRSLGYL